MLRRIVIIAMSKSHRWTPPTSPPARQFDHQSAAAIARSSSRYFHCGFCHGRGARTQKVIVMECE